LGQKLLAARILQKLAEASRSRSDFATAATNHAEAAEAWQEFAGPQAPEVRNNLIQLAQDYILLQRYDEAETLLIDLLDEEEQAEAHPDDLLRILRPLVVLYQKQGRGDRVAAIRNRVDQLERLKKERRTTAEAAV
jgi:lipopolysaccharide biosynthesis regulator YciM